MDEYSRDYSHIATYSYFKPYEYVGDYRQKCDDCYYQNEFYYGCSCPERNGKPDFCGDFTVYQVRVHGAPVKGTPNDSTYNVRKFVQKEVWQPDISIFNMTEDDLVEEFSMTSTDDPRDLEKSYRDHLTILKNTIPGGQWSKDGIQKSNFTAKQSPDKYLDQFFQIVRNVIDPPPDREQSDNAHVGRRKKGHSHAS